MITFITKADLAVGKIYKYLRLQDLSFHFWELNYYGNSHLDAQDQLGQKAIAAGTLMLDRHGSFSIIDPTSVTLKIGTMAQDVVALEEHLGRKKYDQL